MYKWQGREGNPGGEEEEEEEATRNTYIDTNTEGVGRRTVDRESELNRSTERHGKTKKK